MSHRSSLLLTAGLAALAFLAAPPALAAAPAAAAPFQSAQDKILLQLFHDSDEAFRAAMTVGRSLVRA